MSTATALFNENQGIIMTAINNVVYRKVGTQDGEDVSQNALMKTFKAIERKLGKGEAIKNFGGLASTIASGCVSDYYREGKRLMDANSFAVCFNDGVEEDGEDVMDFFSVESVETGYGISEMRADYELNKSAFTGREQEVIDQLLYNSDAYAMNTAELAGSLEINKSHASRAITKLRGICN